MSLLGARTWPREQPMADLGDICARTTRPSREKRSQILCYRVASLAVPEPWATTLATSLRFVDERFVDELNARIDGCERERRRWSGQAGHIGRTRWHERHRQLVGPRNADQSGIGRLNSHVAVGVKGRRIARGAARRPYRQNRQPADSFVSYANRRADPGDDDEDDERVPRCSSRPRIERAYQRAPVADGEFAGRTPSTTPVAPRRILSTASATDSRVKSLRTTGPRSGLGSVEPLLITAHSPTR